MKPATLEDAPVGAAPASLELIPHEWSDGACKNPETVVIDFGGKSPDSAATILLGADAEGRWHYGYDVTPKKAARATRDVTEADSHATRQDALRAALAAVGVAFNKAKDKKGALAIAGYYEAHFSAQPLTLESSPANNGDATPALPPLPKGRYAELPVTMVFASPENARKVFDPVAEQELADSIAKHGLLQAIAVRRLTPAEMADFGQLPMASAELYEIILGERRWRAHRRLERATIDCKVYEGVTRAQAKAAALVENLHRVDLNPIEEAEGYRDLMAAEQLTQEQCAKRVGRSRPVVANALRVLNLPEGVVALIRERKLTIAHGVALARFSAWPKVVAVLAQAAAKDGVPAADLEGKGLPLVGDLLSAGAAVRIEYYKFDHDLPDDLKKSSALFKDGDYSHYFLEPAIYEAALKGYEAKKKAALEAEKEKERKKAEAAAKNPKKIKSLDDLLRGSFAEVGKSSQSLLGLVPEDAVHEVKGYDDEKVTICTKPDLFRAIEKAVADLKKADRVAKLPPLVEKARAKIAKIKKLGARELTLLFLFTQADECQPARLTPPAAKRQGVKLPARLLEGRGLELQPADLKILSEQDPVELWRVLADNYLECSLTNDWWDGSEAPDYDVAADGQACVLLRHLLEVDELGLLEESKSGQKQLVETVKTAVWYQKAIAKIEGEATAVAAEEAKPSKKAGK